MSLPRRLLLPIAALQIAVPALPQFVNWQDTVGDSAAEGLRRAPESPPGVFFAIWGPIFLSFLAFAVYAALRNTHLSRRLAPPLCIAGVLASVWMLVEQAGGPMLVTYPVLLALAAAAWTSARRFDQMRGLGGSPAKFTADIATGLYAGWMTVATAIATTDSVRAVTGAANTDAVWQFLLLALAIAAGGALVAFTRITRSIWYVAALAWGLCGIVVNLWFTVDLHVPAVATATLALALIARRVLKGANGAMDTP